MTDLKEKKTWTTQELEKDFEVIAFLAPYVQVKRKADDIMGTLTFSGSPREYSDFVDAT